jgi:PadR family transcriptional regulator, regulatory protein AphA
MLKSSTTGSRTRYLILGLLSEGPMSGYDLARITKVRFRFFWSESYGQIYPELGKLAGEGLIAQVPGTGARRRRTWSISSEGRAALVAWVLDPTTNDLTRSESLLKAYFSSVAGPEALHALLGAIGERAACEVRILEGFDAELRDAPDPHGNHAYVRMTIDLGISTYKLWVEWADRWARELARGDKGGR